MRALGLMSGTSCDGVSAAVWDGRRVRAYATTPYPRRLRERLLAAPTAPADEVCRLHAELGRFFVRAARRVAGRVDLVGSHGHTIWHEPGATLQIGDPSPLALAYGVPVVHDFRSADVAAGGTGAPLVPRFDLDRFGDAERAMVNIGGIANVTFTRGRPVAYDIGPGNMLIDEAARRLGKPMDAGGRIASRGGIDGTLLERLLAHPFLRRPPPKSTGREEFGRLPVSRVDADVVATLTFFTAKIIADAVRGHGEVVIGGGGVFNPVLMGHLREMLPRVRSIAEFGIHPLAKEPAAFAHLAMLRLRGRPGNVPAATGARRAVPLGSVLLLRPKR